MKSAVASASDYRVFGLNVRSSIPLPELHPVAISGEADVTVTLGPVPEPEGAQPGLIPLDGGLLLVIPDVGRYRIECGRRITVEPAPGVPERNLRLFLLGSAFGALLHQRGLLPLHANAVEIGGLAVAFMGESGAGKSTLAAWFHDRGYRLLADDVCVVRFADNGRALAMPGIPRLRLWADALATTGREPREFERSYVSDDDDEKYDVPIGSQALASEPLPIAAIFVLARGFESRVERLAGVDAAEAVFAHTYRGALVRTLGAPQSFWSSAVRLVQFVPIFRLERVWDLNSMDDQFAALLDGALGELSGEAG